MGLLTCMAADPEIRRELGSVSGFVQAATCFCLCVCVRAHAQTHMRKARILAWACMCV